MDREREREREGCYFQALDFEGERNALGRQARGPSAAKATVLPT